eukprot:359306-Chlamydomonas_euryale.AAC.1
MPPSTPHTRSYDLPPEFNTRFLQYRIQRRACVYRLWGASNNETNVERQYLYSLEPYLHEALLSSAHSIVALALPGVPPARDPPVECAQVWGWSVGCGLWGRKERCSSGGASSPRI